MSKMVPDDEYTVTVHCSNCRCANTIAIKRGTLVADALINRACYQCGCATLTHVIGDHNE